MKIERETVRDGKRNKKCDVLFYKLRTFKTEILSEAFK